MFSYTGQLEQAAQKHSPINVSSVTRIKAPWAEQPKYSPIILEIKKENEPAKMPILTSRGPDPMHTIK